MKNYDELYIIMFLAFFGGFSQLFFKMVKKGETKIPPFILIVAHLNISLFIAALTWLVAHHYKIPRSLAYPLVLLSGFLGYDALFIIHVGAIKHLGKRVEGAGNAGNYDNINND